MLGQSFSVIDILSSRGSCASVSWDALQRCVDHEVGRSPACSHCSRRKLEAMVDYAMHRTQMAVEEDRASSPVRTDMSSRSPGWTVRVLKSAYSNSISIDLDWDVPPSQITSCSLSCAMRLPGCCHGVLFGDGPWTCWHHPTLAKYLLMLCFSSCPCRRDQA